MAEMTMVEINSRLADVLKPMVGQPCSAVCLGEWKSISLWFGVESSVSGSKRAPARSEYGVGTYTSNWMIQDQPGKIVCDPSSQSAAEIEALLDSVKLGSFRALTAEPDGMVQLVTDSAFSVKFISHDLEDELLHVFLPGDLYVEYSLRHGWRNGSSKGPWGGGQPL